MRLQNKAFRGCDDDDDLEERAEALNPEIHANPVALGGQQAIVMPADPHAEFHQQQLDACSATVRRAKKNRRETRRLSSINAVAILSSCTTKI